MKAFFLWVFCFSVSVAVAQNRNSVWCFGDSAGVNFNNLNNPIPYFTTMDGRGSAVSIQDSVYNVLFYAYTSAPQLLTNIKNSNNDTLLSSKKLQGGGLYEELTIVPFIKSNKFYLFHSGPGGFVDTLYYSIIDMNLDNGKGAVIKRNAPFLNVRTADCVNAIKNGATPNNIEIPYFLQYPYKININADFN